MNFKLAESIKNDVIKKMIALLLIVVLTMFDFILLGTEIVSYAADAIETATNNKNVTFDVYFKDESGAILTEKEEKINNDNIHLFVHVSVKNDGYFNGTISLDKGNFNLKNEILSSSINKIEENTITLNQINSGEIVEFEVGITPVKDDIINSELLSMESTISINGIYRNIKEKDINISAKRDVRLILTNPYDENEGIELETNIITNKVYNINGESKRVVQVLVESGLKNNEYPIKENNIEMSVPNGVERVEVISRGMLSSNGKFETDFNTNNWEYSEEEQKVRISIKNEEENKEIKWIKNGKDKIVVTYIMDSSLNPQGINISAKSSITMYDTNATIKETTAEASLSEEIDGVITSEIILDENNIFKGKIYSEENRDYKVTTNIYVNNSETEKNAIVELLPSTYESSLGEISANIQYKNGIVNKNDVLRILGEDGNLKILTLDGDLVTVINKESEADENGNVIINYQDGLTALRIETTEAVATGTISINNIKTIKSDGNSRAIKSTYSYIIEKSSDMFAKIGLQETKSVAKIQSNKSTLSTLTENTGVEITATLKTNSEENDLYKNPDIRITLPSQVENVTLNSVNLLYEDELQVASQNIIEENGRKVIAISVVGEQTKHNDGNVEGATLIINANLNLNRKATNSDEALKMSYTNQSTGITSEIEQPIQIVSPRGMVTINSIEDYGMSVIGEEETKTSKLALSSEAKESEVNIEVINNNEETVKDVKIIGDFPTKNDTNTIETTVSALEVTNADATVYYTENINATEDITDSANGWKAEITDNASVKKYLISVDNMEQSQGLTASYKLSIPEGLQYNAQAYEGYKVTYSNANTTNQVLATTLGLSTGKGPELKTSMKAKTGSTELTAGAEIAQGEILKYEITVENTGTETAENVSISGMIPEGTIYIEPKEDYIYEDGYYNEYPDKNEATFEIDSIEAGAKVIKTYEVKVTKNAQVGAELENKSTVKYGEATTESETVKSKVVEGNLNITVKRSNDLNDTTYKGNYLSYFIMVENISDKTQRDVSVDINLPEELELINVEIGTDEENEELEATKNIQIGDMEAGQRTIVHILTQIGKLNDVYSKQVAISATAKASNSKEVKSNEYIENLKDFELAISLSANNENGYLKTGDIVEYTIKIENKSNVDSKDIDITDTIPEQLTVQSVILNGEEQELSEDNDVLLMQSIKANSEVEAKINTVVSYDESRTEPVQISNVASLMEGTDVLLTSQEITHVIQAESEEDPEDPEVDPNEDPNQDPDNPSNIKTGLVSGIAWLDENQNGNRDSNEKLLEGINVRLIDANGNIVKDSSQNEISATTNNKGFYLLNNVPEGQYIVVFNYDTSAYAITSYHKDGVSDSKNSDAITKQIQINGEQGTYGVTDTIAVNENGASSIDIGLMKATKFDLELNKYISKVVVQTKKETKTYSYDKASLAKAEIAAKQLQGATVIIEYQIEVKNAGEVAGYVKNVVDYMPSSLKFSSELNNDWYQSGANLYNTSLSNTKLEAGETKTITLTLTKTMTEENTGLVNNKAEIAESYNEAGILDVDSTAGNKAQGEDDMGSADVIIGVKTGAMITYVGLTISIIALIGVCAYFVNKKINKDTDIEVNF